jgi:tetratricopeptide (TPR) repeat protein
MDIAQVWIEEGRKFRDTDLPHMALERYSAAANLLRDSNEPQRLAHTIRHVADIQSDMGHLSDAEASYAEALAICRDDPETGSLDLANTLRGYALLREETGDRTAAQAMWTEALGLYRQTGVQAGVDEAQRYLARLHNS